MLNTMNCLAILLGSVAIVNSAAILQNNHVIHPVEKTSILGPSGSITQFKNFDSSVVSPSSEVTYIVGPSDSSVVKSEVNSKKTDDCIHDNEGVQKHDTTFHHEVIANSPTVLQYGLSSVGKKDSTYEVNYVKQSSGKTSVVGQSGSITQENYPSALNKFLSEIYNFEKNNPVTEKTVLYSVNPVVGKYDVPQGNHFVISPSEKTSVVGPSGSITQEKNYYQSVSNGYPAKVYNVVKNNPVTGKPVVVQQVQPVFEDVAVSHVVNSPAEKTSVVGPSGSITQEKHHYQSVSNEYPAKVYNVVKYNPVTGKPVVVQQVQPVFEKVAVSHVVNSPAEKTSVVGPSGSITQETSYQSVSNDNSAKVYNVVKINPVTGKPVVVQHIQPVVENVAVTQGNHFVTSPSEKTSVVGPSGSITQEKYYQSASNENSANVYNVVKTNTVTGKPVVVQNVQPVVETVAVTQGNHFVTSPSEKTSVVGPSGSITQEKYYQSASNEKSANVYNVVKTNTVTGKPVVVQNVQPVVETVAVTQGNHFVTSPSEKTSVVGPSGSITQEKYYQSASNEKSANVYNVVKTNTVTGKPVVVQNVQPVVETVAVTQGNHFVTSPSEKTSVVGPSGSITQEKYYQSVSNENSAKVYNVVKTNPVTGKPVVVQHIQPVVENVAVTQGNHFVTSPSEKTSVVGPSGSITQEKYYQSASNENSANLYNVVKTNTVTGKPVVVQHVQPVVENVVVTQGDLFVNSPSEKTSVVGPSGSVTQEKYYQYVSNEQPSQLYHVVKNNPVYVIQDAQPVVGNVITHVANSQNEKTSVVGPSGSITQEKYYQYLSNEDPTQTYKIVKQNPTNDHYIVAEPAVGNFVNFPSEKTSIVGPSGSITQEKFSQTNSISGDNIAYKQVSPVLVHHYGTSPSKNVAFVYGNSINNEQFHPIVNVDAIKTTESHYSSSASEEPDCDEAGETDHEHSQHNKNSVANFYYTYPATSNYAVVSGNHVNTPVSYNTVNSEYLVHYGTPFDENTSVVYGSHGVDNSAVKTSIVGPSGSITQESNTKSGYVTKAGSAFSGTVGYVPYGFVSHVKGANVKSKVEYPEIQKYPDITAPDC